MGKNDIGVVLAGVYFQCEGCPPPPGLVGLCPIGNSVTAGMTCGKQRKRGVTVHGQKYKFGYLEQNERQDSGTTEIMDERLGHVIKRIRPRCSQVV